MGPGLSVCCHCCWSPTQCDRWDLRIGWFSLHPQGQGRNSSKGTVRLYSCCCVCTLMHFGGWMFVYCAVFRGWLLYVYCGWFLLGLVVVFLMINHHQFCYGFVFIWQCFYKLQLTLSHQLVAVLTGRCDCSLTVCYLLLQWVVQHCAEVVVECSSHSHSQVIISNCNYAT